MGQSVRQWWRKRFWRWFWRRLGQSVRQWWWGWFWRWCWCWGFFWFRRRFRRRWWCVARLGRVLRQRWWRRREGRGRGQGEAFDESQPCEEPAQPVHVVGRRTQAQPAANRDPARRGREGGGAGGPPRQTHDVTEGVSGQASVADSSSHHRRRLSGGGGTLGQTHPRHTPPPAPPPPLLTTPPFRPQRTQPCRRQKLSGAIPAATASKQGSCGACPRRHLTGARVLISHHHEAPWWHRRNIGAAPSRMRRGRRRDDKTTMPGWRWGWGGAATLR